MRALFIGNITIDDVNGRYRVGGSGYYGGRALAEYLGVDVYVATHIASDVRGLIRGTLDLYGIKVIELGADASPIFIISGGRAVGFRGSSPIIDMEAVKVYAKIYGFEAIYITPIMNEVLEHQIAQVKEFNPKITAIDIQGFVRERSNDDIKCLWKWNSVEVLLNTDIVHGNVREFCFTDEEKDIIKYIKDLSSIGGTSFLVSLDYRGLYLVNNNEVLYIPSLPVETVDDVGAGDILLAVTGYFRAMGMSIVESVVRGIAAAALKTENAYREWFSRELLEIYSKELIESIKSIEV
ncbi:MAG: PfkB family carbohydrate kinase [Ignisphaera sp.]